MKILFLTPFLPYPPNDGGRKRMFNIIKHLSAKFRVDIFSFISDSDRKHVSALKQFCGEFYLFPSPSRTGLLERLRVYHANRKVRKKIKEIMDSNNYDVIQAEKFIMGVYVPDIKSKKIKLVLDPWGVDSEGIYREFFFEKSGLKKLWQYLYFIRTSLEEKQILNRFDYTIAVSRKDMSYFEKFLPQEKLILLPNCVDCEEFVPSFDEREENSLIFTGIMNFRPNVDAVLYFCREIYPFIKQKVKDLKIYIVGKNAAEEILNLKDKDEFVIAGYVEDIKTYLQKANVVIVPMRMGGGTRFKVLEALALGKAVVSTSVGCEGLEVEDKKNILIADEPQKFAESVIYLLKDESVRKKMGQEGRKLIEKKYQWKNRMENIVKYYEK